MTASRFQSREGGERERIRRARDGWWGSLFRGCERSLSCVRSEGEKGKRERGGADDVDQVTRAGNDPW